MTSIVLTWIYRQRYLDKTRNLLDSTREKFLVNSTNLVGDTLIRDLPDDQRCVIWDHGKIYGFDLKELSVMSPKGLQINPYTSRHFQRDNYSLLTRCIRSYLKDPGDETGVHDMYMYSLVDFVSLVHQETGFSLNLPELLALSDSQFRDIYEYLVGPLDQSLPAIPELIRYFLELRNVDHDLFAVKVLFLHMYLTNDDN